MFRVVELMVDSGINLAWVPRQDIVLELVNAPDATARDVVLIDREGRSSMTWTSASRRLTMPILPTWSMRYARRCRPSATGIPEPRKH